MSFFTDSLPLAGEATAVSSTDALINRCLAGEAHAYAALYKQQATYMYRVIYGLLQNKEDAEEVLQDTFEYAFRQLAQFDPQKSAFRTWLYRIAISRCRNKRRRKWLPSFSLSQLWGTDSAEVERDIADPEATAPEEATLLTAEQERVWRALGQLSDKLRETAVLRYYDGLAYPEIGEILGISSKTVESRMRLAHKALREILVNEQ